MIRTFDATALNRIANDETVKSDILSVEDLDFQQVLDNPLNFCLMTDKQDGGYLLYNKGDGRYEVHTMSLPSARGRPMYRAMLDGFRFMFTETDCLEITTFLPDSNLKAIEWAKVAGFQDHFRSRSNYLQYKGQDVSGMFGLLTWEHWATKSKSLEAEGAAFHKLLEDAQGHLDHPHDSVHDRVVGATILGIKAGNSTKAINLYNRWARTAGYEQSAVITLHPLLVNIKSSILQLFGQEIKVMKVLS